MKRVRSIFGFLLATIAPASIAAVFQATGIKIGEVRQTEAIVWTPATGLNEFGCGPTCFGMAEGFATKVPRTPMHQFLRIDGGFLSVSAVRTAGKPVLTLRHHDVGGSVVYEHRIDAADAR